MFNICVSLTRINGLELVTSIFCFFQIYTKIFFPQRCTTSLSLLNRVSCMPFLPAWSTCPKRANFSFLRANVPKACQFFNLACQCAKRRAIFFQLHLRKGVPIFQRFFKRITFFMFIIYLYLIYFIYFVCFKYIPNIYFLY